MNDTCHSTTKPLESVFCDHNARLFRSGARHLDNVHHCPFSMDMLACFKIIAFAREPFAPPTTCIASARKLLSAQCLPAVSFRVRSLIDISAQRHVVRSKLSCHQKNGECPLAPPGTWLASAQIWTFALKFSSPLNLAGVAPASPCHCTCAMTSSRCVALCVCLVKI